MDVTVAYLMQVIGEQAVEIRLLRQQITELLKKEKTKKSNGDL